jgi:hypothetical protein
MIDAATMPIVPNFIAIIELQLAQFQDNVTMTMPGSVSTATCGVYGEANLNLW